MEKKYVLISLDDEITKKITEALGNKTCKKIISFLAENDESSEKDIADALGMPINTIEYNLKKLIEAELIEKTKKFFWSKKGRKIDLYTVSEKSIIISPKAKISSKIKSILPIAIISGLGAILVKIFFNQQTQTIQIEDTPQEFMTGTGTSLMQLPSWTWFLVGAIITLTFFIIYNWKKL